MPNPTRRIVFAILGLGFVFGAGNVATCQEKTAQQRRRELLRHSSDLGIGMSLREHRDYKPASDLEARRKALGIQPPGVWLNWQFLSLDAGVLPSRGSRQIISPTYQWRAPVIGTQNGRPAIQPGRFGY